MMKRRAIVISGVNSVACEMSFPPFPLGSVSFDQPPTPLLTSSSSDSLTNRLTSINRSIDRLSDAVTQILASRADCDRSSLDCRELNYADDDRWESAALNGHRVNGSPSTSGGRVDALGDDAAEFAPGSATVRRSRPRARSPRSIEIDARCRANARKRVKLWESEGDDEDENQANTRRSSISSFKWTVFVMLFAALEVSLSSDCSLACSQKSASMRTARWRRHRKCFNVSFLP